jgi:hypothetical protein
MIAAKSGVRQSRPHGTRSPSSGEAGGSFGAPEAIGEAHVKPSAVGGLDNCEHVVEPVAELAERLLRPLPGLRLLGIFGGIWLRGQFVDVGGSLVSDGSASLRGRRCVLLEDH